MKNILVPVDLDDRNDLIIKKAVELAEKFEAKIWLLHIAAPESDFVGNEPGPQYIRDVEAKDLRRTHREIQEMRDQLVADGLDAEALLVQGATVAGIYEEALKINADLIVLGYSDHSFFHNLWFGNNTIEVLKKSEIPLLVVPLWVSDREEINRD